MATFMNNSSPKYTPPANLQVKNNQLAISGISLTQLSNRVGQTPFYAYDRSLINQRFTELRKNMPNDLKIHYALKANPMPALVQHMATLADGFDIASAGEMKTALDTTMSAKNISIAGPGKRPQELQQAISAGITINIESKTELSAIEKISDQLGLAANIAIRINPSFELKMAGVKMGGGAKPFGIDEEQVPSVLKSIKAMNLSFKGFHVYSGSQNLKEDSIIEAQNQTFLLIEKLSEYCPTAIETLNIGGGFGIPYFIGDTPINTQIIGDQLNESMLQFKKNSPHTDIVIELGRYLVGEAGIYVCQVIDKKISRGKTFLVVNGGLHHHLAASGNFGQIIRKNYPIAIGNKIESDTLECVDIVGPLCTPLDILASNIDLPVAEVGDFIAVFQSGAYGYTASPHQFLSQPACEEVIV